VKLAARLGAEIVSMDSMALYRGMDIGTAKPNADEQTVVPHHLIDVIEPHEEFSLAQYVDAARDAVAQIESRGRVALFVGGTPLYLKALLRGIFEGPPADWALRARWQQVADEQGSPALHRELVTVDPQAAEKLHPNDTRRLIRALEVYHLTGTPISVHQQQFERPIPREQCRVFQLQWPRPELHRRIDQRVEAMFAAGLVEEVQRLMAAGPLSRTAAQALGYREVIEYLQGQRSLEETVALVQQRTRQFAKRQETWFRSLDECRAVPMHEGIDLDALAEQMEASGRQVLNT
jgi:tRNA dimethylallyltransferase